MANDSIEKLGSVKPKLPPQDANQLAHYIVAHTAGMSPEQLEGKNLMAVVFGSMGGKKGGDARAKSLTAAKRSKIAKKAAKARWGK